MEQPAGIPESGQCDGAGASSPAGGRECADGSLVQESSAPAVALALMPARAPACAALALGRAASSARPDMVDIIPAWPAAIPCAIPCAAMHVVTLPSQTLWKRRSATTSAVIRRAMVTAGGRVGDRTAAGRPRWLDAR